MAEPEGAAYLKAGGAELFKKHTSKIFRKRDNETLLKIDKALADYVVIPHGERRARTAALLALIALCDHWLAAKQTKIDGGGSFRARAVKALHEAAGKVLHGLKTIEGVRDRILARNAPKQNWATTLKAVEKIIPKGSVDGAGGAPVRTMQVDNWLEILDKHHRRGQELKAHFRAWEASGEKISFWDYLEKLDPAAKKELEKVSVHYVDDLVHRELFAVRFQNGLMWSRMSPPVQSMIIGKNSSERILAQADDAPLDTTKWLSSALVGMSTGWGAFVLSPKGVIYAGIHANGVFHHSSFLCGAPVLASGMIRVEKGKVTGVHEKNGHYRSQEVHLMTFLKLLQQNMRGIDWHKVDYFTFSGRQTTVGDQLGLPRVPDRTNRPHLSSAQGSGNGAPKRSGRALPQPPLQRQS